VICFALLSLWGCVCFLSVCCWCQRLLICFNNEMECFEFWSFYIGTDITQVYIAGANGLVLSCLGGLSEKN
jgi:hypothetical protein